MTATKKMSDLVSDGVEKLSTAKAYAIEWTVKISGVTLYGTIRIRSKDSKAKVQGRARRMICNVLGAIGVSYIDTETFKATVTDAK